MPKYLVTSGSYFKPFTYDELVKPLQQVTDAYNAAQDAYDVLSLETEALDQYIPKDSEENREARRIYDDYRSKLSALQKDLYDNGYNANTRKYLSEARAGYANGIKRLQTAIQNRQARSKAYWDTAHKNPDAIMGIDPGTAGLDKYLADENYGTNWFTYDGGQFMKEVATQAQARAVELERQLGDAQKPVPGYIKIIKKKGFTNNEVDNAVAAVRSGNASGLSDTERFLANTLASSIAATGANPGEGGNITPEQFDRFFNYGRTGLSAGIGGIDSKDYQDKVWENSQDWAMWKRKYDYSHANDGSGNGSVKGDKSQPQGPGYVLNTTPQYIEPDGSKEKLSLLKRMYKNKQYGVPVSSADGSPDHIDSYSDAESILDSFGRSTIRNAYGVDPDNPVGTWTVDAGNGQTEQIRVTEAPDSTDFDTSEYQSKYLYWEKNRDGQWVVNKEQSKNLSRSLEIYNNQYNEWKKNNPDVDLKSLAMPSKERNKYYKAGNIPENVPFEYVPAILATQASVGYKTAASISDTDKANEYYKSQIFDSYGKAHKDNRGRVEKTGEYAFYPVDGFNIGEKGAQVLDDIFGKDKNTKIQSISIFPEDLVREKPRVRAVIGGVEKAFSPMLLGNTMATQIYAMKDDVEMMMLPILDPINAVMMSIEHPELASVWNDVMSSPQMLGNLMDWDIMGVNHKITPLDVVMNPNLQEALRSATTVFMNRALAYARDLSLQNQMQVPQSTSAHPSEYNVDVIE